MEINRNSLRVLKVNIVVIVADTFRRDHLGCYGNKKIKTPNLDSLSEKALVFDRCYACSFPTMPARADLLTGRWTYTFMGWEPLSETLAPPKTTLAECLQQSHKWEDYTTMAVVDVPFSLRNSAYIHSFNYDRGFKDYIWIRGQGDDDRRDINIHRRYETDYCAPATMVAAEKWLQRHHKEEFFLYIDTWDPHEPWDPPQYYIEKYYPNYDGRIVEPCYDYWEKRGLTEEDLKLAHATYCGELTMVDRWIGYLLNGMGSMGLMENTMIIFTTDHGFYFGEHGILGKMIFNEGYKVSRSSLYEEVARIPLLMYIPGIKKRRIDSLVSLPDLMPTILEYGKTKIPDTVQARSIVPIVEGKKDEIWDFVVTSPPLKGIWESTHVVDSMERQIEDVWTSTITSKEWSLLYSIEGEPAELYHLPSDPKQEINLINEEKELAQKMLDKYVSLLNESGVNPSLINQRRHI
jgi:arylsulfatase A-like enzyme